MGTMEMKAPPSYEDEKRARLLENAAREARDRRAKEEAEGRPTASPFAGGPKREPTNPDLFAGNQGKKSEYLTGNLSDMFQAGNQSGKPEASQEKPDSARKSASPRGGSSPDEGTGSTTNLLGKNDGHRAERKGEGDDYDPMSINEILKKKVQDKNKPKKVVSS